MQNKHEPVQTNNKINELVNTIKWHFTDKREGSSFQLYPFCNEIGWPEIIKHLKQISYDGDNINVSLLFGESNFLSLLPWISSSLVILADINPPLHKHTALVTACFQKSNSPQEFLDYYLTEAPELKLYNCEGKKYFDRNDLELNMKESMKHLGKYHFLTNQDTFDQCKNAFNKISIVNIYLNLLDEDACARLNTFICYVNAKLILANITNIHAYVDRYQIKRSVDRLLYKQNPLLVYSEQMAEYSELRAICVNESKDLFIQERWGANRYERFLKIISSYPSVIEHFLENNPNFSKINQEKKPKNRNEFSYIGYPVNETVIKDFLANKHELFAHPFGFNLRAHNTRQEAKDFVIKDIEESNVKYNSQKPLDDYWIITLRGTSEKTNQKLRFFDNQFATDQHTSRFQLFSRAICATNSDRSKIIEKEEAIKEVGSTLTL